MPHRRREHERGKEDRHHIKKAVAFLLCHDSFPLSTAFRNSAICSFNSSDQSSSGPRRFSLVRLGATPLRRRRQFIFSSGCYGMFLGWNFLPLLSLATHPRL